MKRKTIYRVVYYDNDSDVAGEREYTNPFKAFRFYRKARKFYDITRLIIEERLYMVKKGRK